MKTSIALATLAAGALLALDAPAQHASHPPQDPASSGHQAHAQHGTAQPAAQQQPPPQEPAPDTAPEPADHAAMGHAMPSQPQEADHTAMGHPAAPQSTQQVDHAAMGHATPAPQPQVDHAAMGHAMPRAPGQPVTPIPALTDADRAAAAPPPRDHPVHDDSIQHFVLLNRLEAFDADGGTGVEWEGQAWIGKDLEKLWVRSEGQRSGGRTGAADLEVLYGRAIAPWWELVAGLRHDFKPGESQDFAAIGIQGLAPYKIEVQATAYLGESGRTAARVEVEYETLLTNRLILQPLVELNFHGSEDARRGIGSGLGTVEAGLRLRYEIRREFAPYIGVVHERAFGGSADFRREHGEGASETRLVAGVRVWL